MGKRTSPPIAEAQNSDTCEQLLAAQAVLYGDVKHAMALRLQVMVVAALMLSVFTIWVSPGAAWVGGVGGVVVLIASILASRRERRLVDLAVSIQEQFDTMVFQLPWNNMCVPERPAGQQVHEAAARYNGNRTKDWYPDTRAVHRPLDVLICQQANLGWGASMHRKWLAVVLGSALVLVAVLAGVWAGLRLNVTTGLNALIIPFVPVLLEALNEALRHHDAARDKKAAQQLILGLWRSSLTRRIKQKEVRAAQDSIVQLRRANARVPDWFDSHFRVKSEHAMRATADDMIAEAAEHGKA